MPCSPAQLAANRANGLKSTGPKTAEGKAISRRNALKHGMAGRDRRPRQDAAEVARRPAALTGRDRPEDRDRPLPGPPAGRADRPGRVAPPPGAGRHRPRVAHAGEAFDEARIAEVDELVAWIGKEPATHARKLRSMPEGVDRVIALPDRTSATRSARPGGTGSTARGGEPVRLPLLRRPDAPDPEALRGHPAATSSTSTPRTSPAWPTRPGASGQCSNSST